MKKVKQLKYKHRNDVWIDPEGVVWVYAIWEKRWVGMFKSVLVPGFVHGTENFLPEADYGPYKKLKLG